MERLELSVKLRDKAGKEYAQKLRQAGMIPAVAYGFQKETMHLEVSQRDLAMLLNTSDAKSPQVDLLMGEQRLAAMVKNYQIHPVHRTLVHCDFLLIHEDRKASILVPVRTKGRSKGEEAGGRLKITQREVRVQCLPKDQPTELFVDVTQMRAGETLYIDQIPFPEGVTPVFKMRFPVVSVAGKEADAKAEEGAPGKAE